MIIIHDWIKSEGRQVMFHGDDKIKINDTQTGCGHIDLATSSRFEETYGIPRTWAQQALAMHQYATDTSEISSQAILTGHHNEEAVLINNDPTSTIPSTIYDSDQQPINVFRYDKAAQVLRLTSLASYLIKKGYVDMGQRENLLLALQTTAEKQTQATLQVLAHNLPILTRDLQGNITHTGNVK